MEHRGGSKHTFPHWTICFEVSQKCVAGIVAFEQFLKAHCTSPACHISFRSTRDKATPFPGEPVPSSTPREECSLKCVGNLNLTPSHQGPKTILNCSHGSPCTALSLSDTDLAFRSSIHTRFSPLSHVSIQCLLTWTSQMSNSACSPGLLPHL
jgi:hypothetical protein